MGAANIATQTGLSVSFVTRLLRCVTYDDYIKDLDRRNKYCKEYQQKRLKRKHPPMLEVVSSRQESSHTPIGTPFAAITPAAPKHLIEVGNAIMSDSDGPVTVKVGQVDYTPHTMEDYQRENKMLRERLEELRNHQRELDTAIIPKVVADGKRVVTEIEMKNIKIIVREQG